MKAPSQIAWFYGAVASMMLAGDLVCQEAQPGPVTPLTVAERSGFAETSRCEDVTGFVAALRKLPGGRRLVVSSAGASGEGRDLQLVIASSQALGEESFGATQQGLIRDVRGSGRLRLLVVGNIHAGEVDGKEAIQVLLREIVQGRHDDLLEHAELLFLPIYNPDGNERISERNRVSQNGPEGGVGERGNAAGLDLNRDCIKTETPEFRALLGIYRDFDPHLMIDCHTTNGCNHGYHLTYAPSTSTNVDRDLDLFASQEFLPEVRAEVGARHLIRIHDYGNFSRRAKESERVWRTFGHRPRYSSNYYGLRNRIGVLAEAYAYQPFETRIMAQRAFVLETLRAAVRHRERIEEMCRTADRRTSGEAGSAEEHRVLPYATEYAPAVPGEILVSTLEAVEVPDLGKRYRVLPGFRPVRMPIQVRYRSKMRLAYPMAWGIVDAPPEVIAVLHAHGVVVERLVDRVVAVLEIFEPTERTEARREYQGHRLVRLGGRFAMERRELPRGTIIVRPDQPLARVAAQLLEPISEDGLATWNYFDAQTRVVSGARPEGFPYPVVRILDKVALTTEPVEAEGK